MQLVGNRELVGDKVLELPSLPASELASFQNHAGLRDRARTGRPYPAFHGMRESSTCGFVFADYVMLGGCRPSPVNRHGFGIAGRAGARLAPTMGPAPAGWPLSGWRPASRKRKTAGGGTRDVPRAPERRAAASPPRANKAIAGLRGPTWGRGASDARAPAPEPAKVFPKLSLHQRPSSRIVLLRTGA